MEIKFNLQNSFFKKDQKTFTFTKDDGTELELSINILQRILSLIAHQYLYNRQENSEYTQIHSDKFSQIDPNYKSYIKWLKRNEIIISDNHYEIPDHEKGTEGKCISYAFDDHFKNWGMVTSMRKDRFDEVTNKDQSYLISIDKSVLRNIRRDFKAVQINDKPIEKSYKIDTEELQIIDFKSYLSSEFNFWRAKNHDTYYNWKSGRLYTNFCQCSKTTRLNNFYFDDTLSNLDIPSSFPLWLAVWLKNNGMDTENYEYRELCTVVKPKMDQEGNFYKNDEGEIKTNFYNDLRSKMNNNRNQSLSETFYQPITTCQLLIDAETVLDQDGIPIETEKVKCGEPLEEGGFCPTHGYFEWNVQPVQRSITKCQRIDQNITAYDRDGFPTEYEKKKCNLKLEEGGWCPVHGYIEENDQSSGKRLENNFISKSQAKEDFQFWLNGDNDRTTLINFIFKTYYGDVQSIVDQHKNHDKKFMYYQLVAMETNFIFNTICARLYSEIPAIKILTCHDQIYFEKRYHAQVEAIWIEELKKVYDQLPSHEDVEYDYEEIGVFIG